MLMNFNFLLSMPSLLYIITPSPIQFPSSLKGFEYPLVINWSREKLSSSYVIIKISTFSLSNLEGDN